MFPLLLATSVVAAGMAFNLMESETAKQNPHRIYLKPNFFVGDPYRSEFPSRDQTAMITFKVDRPFYAGVDLVYEFSIPDSLYVSAQWTDAISSVERSFSFSTGENITESMNYSISNLEASVGKNFQPAESGFLTTPFVGFGRYRETTAFAQWKSEPEEKYDQYYVALGNRFMYRFSKFFDLGIHAKLMRPVYYKASNFSASASKLNFFAYEIALPSAWHLKNNWEIQLEPYMIKLNTNVAQSFLGGRVAVGHSF